MSRCCCWQCQPDGFAELGLQEIVVVVFGECLAQSLEERDLVMGLSG